MMYISGCEPPERWSTTLPQLWPEPNKDTVIRALERLPPSRPKGWTGYLHSCTRHSRSSSLPSHAATRHMHEAKGEFSGHLVAGHHEITAERAREPECGKWRAIILLNTRAKWATIILKLGMDDYLRAIIPKGDLCRADRWMPTYTKGTRFSEREKRGPGLQWTSGRPSTRCHTPLRKRIYSMQDCRNSGSQASCPSSEALLAFWWARKSHQNGSDRAAT